MQKNAYSVIFPTKIMEAVNRYKDRFPVMSVLVNTFFPCKITSLEHVLLELSFVLLFLS